MDFHWFDVLDFRFRLSFHIIIHNLASISPKLRAKHCLWVCVASILLPLQTLFAILFGSFNITLFIQVITSHRKKQQVTIANSHFTTPLIVHQEDSQHFYKIPVICLKQWAMKWNSSALICWRHFINRHPFFALFVVFSTAPWHKINICISVVIFFLVFVIHNHRFSLNWLQTESICRCRKRLTEAGKQWNKRNHWRQTNDFTMKMKTIYKQKKL